MQLSQPKLTEFESMCAQTHALETTPLHVLSLNLSTDTDSYQTIRHVPIGSWILIRSLTNFFPYSRLVALFCTNRYCIHSFSENLRLSFSLSLDIFSYFCFAQQLVTLSHSLTLFMYCFFTESNLSFCTYEIKIVIKFEILH